MSRMKDEMEKIFKNKKEEVVSEPTIKIKQNIFKPVKPGDFVIFKYRNWKNEVSYRKAVVKGVFFGTTDFHEGFQCFMKAFDIDKLEDRDFAVVDILYMDVYPT